MDPPTGTGVDLARRCFLHSDDPDVGQGAGGDLQVGLPLQSLFDADQACHEPMRLLTVVQAPRTLLEAVIARNPVLRELFDGQWVHLAARDNEHDSWKIRRPDGTWAAWTPTGTRTKDRYLEDGEAVIVDDSDQSISLAVGVLRAGRVVAVPTETVYGLAADASSPEAVSRVFAAKGRPVDHPLIVHLGTGASLADWAQHVPNDASRLADALWPGPLTLVLQRHPSVPTAVTGGLDTVALRMPAHPVVQRLLECFGGGLAAPSANRFGRVSPTTAHDVCVDLGSAVDLVIDGGPCEVGVESTIVAFAGGEVTILRPGGISPEAIARVLGRRARTTAHSPVRVPGVLASHYAPMTPLELCTPEEVALRGAELVSTGARVGVLSLVGTEVPGAAVVWDAGGEMAVFARSLYRWLRQADAEALDVLVVALPPDEGLGVAIRDRLRRAAHR